MIISCCFVEKYAFLQNKVRIKKKFCLIWTGGETYKDLILFPEYSFAWFIGEPGLKRILIFKELLC